MKADYHWFLEDFFYYLAVIYYYIVMYFNVNVNTMRHNPPSFIFIEVTNSVGTQLERRRSKLHSYTVLKVTSLSSMLVGCMYNKFSARWFTSKKHQTTKHGIHSSRKHLIHLTFTLFFQWRFITIIFSFFLFA